MAQATKKQTKTTKKTSTGSRAKKNEAAESAAAKKRPIRREVGAGICALLALCTLFAIFGHEAVILNWLWYFCRGLVGWGTNLLPILLIVAAVKLLFHRGKPVRLRVTCTLLIAPFTGAIAHLFSAVVEYESIFAMFGALYTTGTESASGGLIGGTLAVMLRSGLGKILSAILLILLTCAAIAVAFWPQIKRLMAYLQERERPEYEEEPEPERPVKEKVPEKAVSEPATSREKTPAAIDIPEPGEPSRRELRREKKAEKKLLRDRKVASPDEVADNIGVNEMAPDYGKLPIDAPLPKDPVPPLDMKPGLFHEPSDTEEEVIENAPPFLEEEPSEEIEFGIPAEPVEEQPLIEEIPAPKPSGPVLKPVAHSSSASKPAVEPKIVDTLGAKEKIDEKNEAEAVAAEVAAELGRSVESAQQSYVYPSIDLLNEAPKLAVSDATNEMRLNAQRLADALKSFGIEAKINNVTRGPSVTRYELELERGVKLSKISGLADDIALSLGASGVRIAPIPDKVSIVGIEVPNKAVATVSLREIIESKEFGTSKSAVSFAVGRDISGSAIVGDIEKLPHMLIAGTTGSGKSVCMNSLIISLLYKSSPEQVRLIMVDPKMIELNVYNGIPHLLIPVVTDPKKAAGALQWAVGEMMNRYSKFRDASVRNISEYNAYVEQHEGMKKMPQVVILIDELADLMMVSAKEVEESICRIAQMARAAGMHLVIATQSPRADVITGIMKANIPSRIAFAVASSLESRIIMDNPGAEKLVGRGDMLYLPVGSRKSTRVQGCFVSSAEVERVVEFVKKSGEASYSEEVLSQIEKAASEGTASDGGGSSDGADDFDEMLPAAVEVLLETGQASVSMLQRRLKLGYARAARLVDQLERRGIVGPFEGAKPRQLLITRAEWEEMKLQNPEYQ